MNIIHIVIPDLDDPALSYSPSDNDAQIDAVIGLTWKVPNHPAKANAMRWSKASVFLP